MIASHWVESGRPACFLHVSINSCSSSVQLPIDQFDPWVSLLIAALLAYFHPISPLSDVICPLWWPSSMPSFPFYHSHHHALSSPIPVAITPWPLSSPIPVAIIPWPWTWLLPAPLFRWQWHVTITTHSPLLFQWPSPRSLLSYSSGHNSMTLNLIATSIPLPVPVTCHHHHALSSPIPVAIPSEPVHKGTFLTLIATSYRTTPQNDNTPK